VIGDMTDFFDPGGGDEQVLAKLREIVREAGLEPYLDLGAVGDTFPSGATIRLLNRTVRLLRELHDLDESLEDAGEWKAIVFMADPALPPEYREPANAPALFVEDARLPGLSVIDRQRSGERHQAIIRAQKLILKLRNAIRNQA